MGKNNNSNKNLNRPLPKQTVSGDTVVVSLKHPQGIRFDLSGKRSVVIDGNAVHLRGKDKGVIPCEGFGMTIVAKADWEEIKKLYGGMRIFKSGLIFASEDIQRAADEADEKDGDLKSGFEPIDPQAAGVSSAAKAD